MSTGVTEGQLQLDRDDVPGDGWECWWGWRSLTQVAAVADRYSRGRVAAVRLGEARGVLDQQARRTEDRAPGSRSEGVTARVFAASPRCTTRDGRCAAVRPLSCRSARVSRATARLSEPSEQSSRAL